MSRYESLQSRAIRKLSPRTLNQLPSPVLMQGRNEMAKYIQRTFRSRNKHATYRKGSRMTKNAMRRQLINAYAFNPERQNNAFRRMQVDFLDMLILLMMENLTPIE